VQWADRDTGRERTIGRLGLAARLRPLLDLGAGPEQAHLRDRALPQRGVFVLGRAWFTDAGG
jgi:hypothetical protein